MISPEKTINHFMTYTGPWCDGFIETYFNEDILEIWTGAKNNETKDFQIFDYDPISGFKNITSIKLLNTVEQVHKNRATVEAILLLCGYDLPPQTKNITFLMEIENDVWKIADIEYNQMRDEHGETYRRLPFKEYLSAFRSDPDFIKACRK
jgi:hypothetical protein